jgi:autotransporter-associated beta strand protein
MKTPNRIPNLPRLLLTLCFLGAGNLSSQAQGTFTWAGTSGDPLLAGNWAPAGGPPDQSTPFSHLVFTDTSTQTLTFGNTATYTAASWLFNRPSGTQQINSNTSDTQIVIKGNLTNSGGGNANRFRYGNSALSLLVEGDILVNSSTLEFGGNFSSTGNGRMGDLMVNGSTQIASGATMNFYAMAGTVSLGELTVNGTFNVLGGGDTGNGTLNSGINTINVTRLHGSGTIKGDKNNATAVTTGLLVVNGGVDVDPGVFSGAIQNGLTNNAVALTKNGANTLTLSGNNTYSGNTAVINGLLIGDSNTAFGSSQVLANGGTTRIAATRVINNSILLNGGELNVRGTASGAVTFGGAGGRLSGDGLISQAITLNNINQVLAPGNSPGVQSFGSSQTWSSFTYEWEANSWTDFVAGTNYDQISIAGSLDLSTAFANSIRLELYSLLGDHSTGNIPGFSEVDRQWAILTATGGITGFDVIHWDIVTTGFTSSPVWAGSWSVSLVGNQIFLNYTAIPEPSTALLFGLGLTAFLLRQRRRRD